MGRRNKVEEFLTDTQIWLEELKKQGMIECPGCGLRPGMFEALFEEVQELKEKAWKYDELSK